MARISNTTQQGSGVMHVCVSSHVQNKDKLANKLCGNIKYHTAGDRDCVQSLCEEGVCMLRTMGNGDSDKLKTNLSRQI